MVRSYVDLVAYSSTNTLPVDQVIREELQRLALRYLSEHGFFIHGVFQGGTAIRLAYGGTRLSEDLDFVLRPDTTLADVDLPRMLEGLPSFLGREVPFADRASLKERKAEPTFARYRCKLELQAPTGGLVINLEFAGVPSRLPKPHIVRSDTVDVAIVVEDESEILVDKLVALALRPYTKGRDIWDTWFLTHEHHVLTPATETVIAKAADYGASRTKLVQGLRHNKERVAVNGLSALDAEMKRFLPARLYDAMAPVFPELNASVAGVMNTFLTQLEATS